MLSLKEKPDALPSKSFEEVTRVGTCRRQCGRCCSIHAWEGHPDIEDIRKIWNTQPFAGLKEDGSCVYLSWTQGFAHCEIYETRPWQCRQFPNGSDDLANIPECEYRFVIFERK